MTVTPRLLTSGPEIHIVYRQSNALGRQTSQTSPPALPRADIRYWYQDIAFGQVLGNVALQDVAPARWAGCELTLGVDLVDVYGHDVAIAKVARGSTGPVEWDPADPTKNSSIMAATVRRFIAILRLVYARDPYVASATFIGGEQEALSAGLAAAMQANLEAQVARIRDDFGPGLPHWVADMPATVGGRLDVNVALCNAGITAAVAADSNLHLLTVSDLAREGDNVHYTPDSQGTIGTRLAAALHAAGAYDPSADSGAVRVSLYPTLARAQYVARALGGALVRVAPVDPLWAVEDTYGPHWVSRLVWSVV